MGRLLAMLAATALVSACAATAPEGKLDPAEAEAAINELFTAQGERVLMQASDSAAAPSTATGAPVGPDEQPLVGVQTSDGLIWMTQAQLDQFIAQTRIEAAALARRVNAYGTQPAAGAQAVAASPTEATPAHLARAAIPGGFERYVAPGLEFSIGPRDFRNVDGSFDCVLTFDDGPHHSNDATIYDILDAKGIRATFFFLGEQVQANPTTALTAVNRGHEVGYHSWDHKNLRAESRETVAEDFRRGMGAFTALGLQPAFFRPPFGNYNAGILEEAAAYGLTTVNWTNDSLDWQIKDAEGIVQRVLSLSAPGDIVLLHSIHERTVEALPVIIDGLRERGCRFTSLETWVARATS